jgi:hypothetical protein
MENLPEIYFADTGPHAPARILRAGSLTCLYLAGALRHISSGETEILRMIYPALRDPDWGTVPGTISDEQIDENRDAFSIRYKCWYREGGIDYLSSVQISGGKDNSLAFSMEGEALSSFRKNRLGLNILHPIRECAGRMCKVCTPGGKEYSARFPVDISPLQPMKDIRSMAWTLAGEIHASLEFSGEVFEMEDQRNWTDASYKTYCTPLDLPFPATVEKGEKLKQTVYLKVKAGITEIHHDGANRVMLAGSKTLPGFPDVGLCRSSETLSMHPKDIELIWEAGFRHYRVDLHLYREGWTGILSGGAGEAIALGLALEIGVFFGDGHASQLAALLKEMRKYKCPVARFLVFTRDHIHDEQLSAALIPVLRTAYPGAGIGTGTNGNFADLNRNRPQTGLPDFLAWPVNPQTHAVDPHTMVENLEGQRDTVVTARGFSEDKAICITPVTLKPRFNPEAKAEEKGAVQGARLPSRFDPRQASLFCAGWTLGSFKYLAESGVRSITYFETSGRGGIIHGFNETLSPEVFMAECGDLYPVYFLFRELLKFRFHRVRITESSHPLRFSSLLLADRDERIMALANHTETRQQILLPPGMKIRESWVMDEYTIPNLRRGEDLWKKPSEASSVSLNPFAVIFLKTSTNI